MTNDQIYRIARLSLRANTIACGMNNKYGAIASWEMVRERSKRSEFDETYVLWRMVYDNLTSMANGQNNFKW